MPYPSELSYISNNIRSSNDNLLSIIEKGIKKQKPISLINNNRNKQISNDRSSIISPNLGNVRETIVENGYEGNSIKRRPSLNESMKKRQSMVSKQQTEKILSRKSGMNSFINLTKPEQEKKDYVVFFNDLKFDSLDINNEYLEIKDLANDSKLPTIQEKLLINYIGKIANDYNDSYSINLFWQEEVERLRLKVENIKT